MAETNRSTQQTHQPNHTRQHLFAALDPKSLMKQSRPSNSSTMAETDPSSQQTNQLDNNRRHLLAAFDPMSLMKQSRTSNPSTMAETNRSSQQINQPNRTPQDLFAGLDPMSLILSQNSNSDGPNFLKLTTESFIMERGPRYKAYAELRESKLRRRNMRQEPQEPESRLTPPKKQVKFQGSFPGMGRKGSSVLAQSVPDFSAALRKENRKPANPLPSMLEMTPPPKKSSQINGAAAKLGGSKSASAGEKRGVGLMARKSYASVEELKGLSSAAATAINGENRGGRTSRGAGKTILGYRQF